MVVVAVGYGESKRAHVDRRDFVEQFMKAVKLSRPVLVCASMSGQFALPFVFKPEPATCTDRLQGFVPIAPASTGHFTKADYSSCKVRYRVPTPSGKSWIFFLENSRTWKVLENHFGPGKISLIDIHFYSGLNGKRQQ